MKNILTAILIMGMGFIISCDNGKNEDKKIQKPAYFISANVTKPNFNSENAYNYVAKQVSFGPRNPNSEAHKKALEFFKTELEKFADEVQLQTFNYPGYENTELQLTNVIAKFNPQAKNRIFFCAHWDSRPRGEKDKNPEKRNLPIPGANDGASGVGILLELARILKENKVDYGIDLILFDGEDYGHESDLMNYCLGAKYFAATKKDYNPHFGILLDLVGDKQAEFQKEGYSIQYAREVVEMVWNIAHQIGATTFSDFETYPIYDDHFPLNQANLKTINIVDIDLIGADSQNPRRNYWHTQNDTMENISKETLQQVGNVLVHLIYSIKFNEPSV